MPAFSSELIKMMRAALEEAISKLPQGQASSAMKTHLAASILKAAAEGHTTHEAFMDAAENELPAILSLFEPLERCRSSAALKVSPVQPAGASQIKL